MNNNQRHNDIAIRQFRKELESMFDDTRDIDMAVLNKAVGIGVKAVKELTNVSKGGKDVDFYTQEGKRVQFSTNVARVGGYMRKSWKSAPAVRSKSGGVTKSIINGMDYSSYVNYGHRIVQGGVTKGFVKGQFMLEKAIGKVDRALVKEFEREVERVNKKHDR